MSARRLLLPIVLLGALSCTRREAATQAPLLADLRAAAQVPRRTAGRLSINETYQRCTPRTIGDTRIWCHAPQGRVPDRVLALAGRAARSARETGAPDAFHATGLIDLIWGDSAGHALDRTVNALESAARLSVEPSVPLSDLSAAYLMRFDLKGDVADLLAGLDAADRAANSSPPSPALLFTRAVLLTRLELLEQAAAAWREYRSHDSTSAWANEAHEHLVAIREILAANHMTSTGFSTQPARELGLDSLLPAWGRAELRSDTLQASRFLAAATAVGDSLRARGGDPSVAAMVQSIVGASPADRRDLAAAHSAYGAGAQAFARGDYATCHDSANVSRARAEPLRGWTRMLHLGCVLHERPASWATAQFGTLARDYAESDFLALAGRAYWGLAASFNKSGRQADALRAITDAQQRFTRIHESENLGGSMHVEAFSRSELREGRPAIEAARRALHQLRSDRQSVWLHNVLWVYASVSSDEGFARAAVRFADEAVRVADNRADPRIMSESRIARARYAVAIGRSMQADLDSASFLVTRIPSGAAREWQVADLLTLQARSGDHQGIERSMLDSVVETFRRAGTPAKLVPALLLRADRALRADHSDLAIRDLQDATRAMDRARLAVEDQGLLPRTTDGVRDALRATGALWIRVGQPLTALAALERSRGVSPRTLDAGLTAIPTLPRSTAVISLAFLGDSIVAWSLADGRWSLTTQPTRRSDFLPRMSRLRARVELGLPVDQLRHELTALYEAVLRVPLSRVPDGVSSITIVGDNVLTALPLAAAIDSTTGQHLVERYTLRFSGSVTAALRSPPLGARARERVLAVGDPALDDTDGQGLSQLRFAEAEVADLRSTYPGVNTLHGPAATVGAVLRSLSGASLFHFAGHARFDVQRPERSALLLAKAADGGRSVLRADEIRSMPLKHVRLVVLSACESASTGAQEHSTSNGLVTAFLDAGASGVLGTIWKVDDRQTRLLMSDFHRVYRRSGDAAGALRLAQVALMKSDPRSVGAWSAFKYETP